jgi:hypothetical protein
LHQATIEPREALLKGRAGRLAGFDRHVRSKCADGNRADREMMAPKQAAPPGPPMTLANMRRQGVRGLNAVCLDPGCRHELIFSADDYPGDTELSWFKSRMVCAKCGGKRLDVQPNWKEKPDRPTMVRLD